MVPIAEQDVRLFSQKPVFTYPGYEIPPYTPLSPDQQTTASRLSSLHQILEHNSPFILIVSIEALMRRVLPKKALALSVEIVMAGEECDLEQLIQSLVSMGYEQVSLVRGVGDFSVRGGIIDIFPPPFSENGSLREGPIRLDFFGDTIESIRLFEPISQRSTDELEEALFLPVSDIIFRQKDFNQQKINQGFRHLTRIENCDSELVMDLTGRIARQNRFAGIEFYLPLFYPDDDKGSASFFDYLPNNTSLFLIDSEACRQTIELVSERIEANFHAAQHKGIPVLSPEKIFLTPDQFHKEMDSFACINCSDFTTNQQDNYNIQSSNHQLIKQDINLQRRKRGVIAPLTDHIADWQDQGQQIIICCRSEKHTKTLAELLSKHNQKI